MSLWDHVFQVNLFAAVMLARGLLDELQCGQGSIVNVTSIAGSRVHRFAGAAYATSKAALAALTREMAADFGPLGIRVNAIAPGEIATSILSPGTADLVPQLPLRRIGTPEEVAEMIYVLCSDQASYVTGAELHINSTADNTCERHHMGGEQSPQTVQRPPCFSVCQCYDVRHCLRPWP
jgi:NAD(P)-dependent dehydrogenase (short-subunit alcohol dehydrogenase family)